jgi:hypothetical protein
MVDREREAGPKTERPLPPVAEVAVATLILVVIGGIDTAAYLPDTPPLWLPLALLAGAVVLLVGNVVMLSLVRSFAWDKFFLVAKWALVAYVVTAGMLEYVFVVDGTPGKVLALLTGMLLVYATTIPLLFAFSVARYQPVSGGH